MGKASKKKSQRRAGIGPSRAEIELQRMSRRMAGRPAAGTATPVPATVPQWAEDSLGDHFFTAKYITDAAQAPPLGGAVLPEPRAMISDQAYWEAASNVLIRAIVLDGVPVSDPAVGAVIDALAPLGLSPDLTGAAAGRALICAVAHDYLFGVPEDTEFLDRLDGDSSTAGNALETLIVAKVLAPDEALLAGLAMLSMLAGLCRTSATSVLGPQP